METQAANCMLEMQLLDPLELCKIHIGCGGQSGEEEITHV
jgi:hypothetical protein